VSALTILWLLQGGYITPVKCTMVTASVVWRKDGGIPIHEARSSTISRFRGYSYHETWEEAHQELLAQAARKLEKAQGDFDRITGMKPPSEALSDDN
jgi:hypothetical protein